MTSSEAVKRAKDKYRREKCDQLTLLVPKGKRAAYRLVADELGVSLAQLVQISVEEFARNHEAGLPCEMKRRPLTGREKVLLERFACLPERAQKNFIQLMGSLAVQCGTQIESDETEGD